MLGRNKWVDMDQFQTEMGFDSSTAVELYEIFAEELSEEIDKLEAATAAAERVLITKIVHNIKGITASYQAGAALTQAVQFDLLCKGEQWQEYDHKLSVFIQTLRQTVAAIRDLLGKVG